MPVKTSATQTFPRLRDSPLGIGESHKPSGFHGRDFGHKAIGKLYLADFVIVIAVPFASVVRNVTCKSHPSSKFQSTLRTWVDSEIKILRQ